MPGFKAPLNAATVDRAFLRRGMDARVHNLDQYDPSPGIDSQLERIRALALRLPPSPECEALMGEIDQAIASNLLEGAEILGITGDADQLVTDLRRRERRAGHEVLGPKAIARRLREPLDLILSPTAASASDLTQAWRILREAIDELPQLMLLSATVEHELGALKFQALRRLTLKQDGAARSAAAGATDERGDAHRAEL